MTAWDPSTHKWAMLIRFGSPSSMSDIRLRRSVSPGNRAAIPWQTAHTCLQSTLVREPSDRTQKRHQPYVQVSLVDLVDDQEMSRQQLLEQEHGPALQRLWENRVVGVGARVTGDVPRLNTNTRSALSCGGGGVPPQAARGSRLVPVQALHIHQDPHQFWDGQSRVGVVQLDRRLL